MSPFENHQPTDKGTDQHQQHQQQQQQLLQSASLTLQSQDNPQHHLQAAAAAPASADHQRGQQQQQQQRDSIPGEHHSSAVQPGHQGLGTLATLTSTGPMADVLIMDHEGGMLHYQAPVDQAAAAACQGRVPACGNAGGAMHVYAPTRPSATSSRTSMHSAVGGVQQHGLAPGVCRRVRDELYGWWRCFGRMCGLLVAITANALSVGDMVVALDQLTSGIAVDAT